MNRVHEQYPKIDSGTVLSQTGSKIGRVHQVHSLLASSTPRLHTQRPCCAMRTCRAPHTCRGLAAPRAFLPRAPRALLRRVVAWLAVSRPCVATQSSSPLPLLSQYSELYCNTVSALFSAIQTSVLQYTSSPSIPLCCNTTEPNILMLQYTFLQYNA